MNFVLRPWQLLLLILAGWINRDQQDAIEYLLTENQVLREKLGKGRILLNDDQRRRLAVKGKVLGPDLVGLKFMDDETPEHPIIEPDSVCGRRFKPACDGAPRHPLDSSHG